MTTRNNARMSDSEKEILAMPRYNGNLCIGYLP